MDTIDDKLKSRLGKLLELARRGVGGEKDNAARMLENLLRKHGLTMADLEDRDGAVPETRWFKFKGDAEKDLLLHIVAQVLNSHEVKGWSQLRGNRKIAGVRGYDLTPAEFAEVTVRFEAHRRAFAAHMKKQAELALTAFIHKNRIFPDEAAAPAGEDTGPKMTPEELAELLAAMRSIKPTPIHKAIGHTAAA